jgi:hypothetical protein
MIKSVNTIEKLSLGQYGKNQSNTDIVRIGPIPVSSITTRSESARHFDNCKEIYNIGLLRDVFHIGLAIGPRPAVLA